MPKVSRPAKQRSSSLRQLFVSEVEIAAARSLLETLTKAAATETGGSLDTASDEPHDRQKALQRAREATALRERRLHAFDFSAEPPFVVLLALYANEEWEPVVTLTRLTQLSWQSLSTTIRWLDVLVDGGLIVRTGDTEDGRKTLLSLSSKGRDALDELFG